MGASAQAFEARLHSLPYDQKWGLLKQQIEQLYIDDGRKLSDLIDEIERRWNFKASSVFPLDYYYHPSPPVQG